MEIWLSSGVQSRRPISTLSRDSHSIRWTESRYPGHSPHKTMYGDQIHMILLNFKTSQQTSQTASQTADLTNSLINTRPHKQPHKQQTSQSTTGCTQAGPPPHPGRPLGLAGRRESQSRAHDVVVGRQLRGASALHRARFAAPRALQPLAPALGRQRPAREPGRAVTPALRPLGLAGRRESQSRAHDVLNATGVIQGLLRSSINHAPRRVLNKSRLCQLSRHERSATIGNRVANNQHIL